MIKGKKRQGFDTIMSLIKSESDEDHQLAKILLMDGIYDYTPNQWMYLHTLLLVHMWGNLSAIDLQKYLYDKRKQERGANKRDNTE